MIFETHGMSAAFGALQQAHDGSVRANIERLGPMPRRVGGPVGVAALLSPKKLQAALYSVKVKLPPPPPVLAGLNARQVAEGVDFSKAFTAYADAARQVGSYPATDQRLGRVVVGIDRAWHALSGLGAATRQGTTQGGGGSSGRPPPRGGTAPPADLVPPPPLDLVAVVAAWSKKIHVRPPDAAAQAEIVGVLKDVGPQGPVGSRALLDQMGRAYAGIQGRRGAAAWAKLFDSWPEEQKEAYRAENRRLKEIADAAAKVEYEAKLEAERRKAEEEKRLNSTTGYIASLFPSPIKEIILYSGDLVDCLKAANGALEGLICVAKFIAAAISELLKSPYVQIAIAIATARVVDAVLIGASIAVPAVVDTLRPIIGAGAADGLGALATALTSSKDIVGMVMTDGASAFSQQPIYMLIGAALGRVAGAGAIALVGYAVANNADILAAMVREGPLSNTVKTLFDQRYVAPVKAGIKKLSSQDISTFEGAGKLLTNAGLLLDSLGQSLSQVPLIGGLGAPLRSAADGLKRAGTWFGSKLAGDVAAVPPPSNPELNRVAQLEAERTALQRQVDGSATQIKALTEQLSRAGKEADAQTQKLLAGAQQAKIAADARIAQLNNRIKEIERESVVNAALFTQLQKEHVAAHGSPQTPRPSSPPSPPATGATIKDKPLAPATPQTTSGAGIFAAAGAGFLVGGPPGAVIGAIIGAVGGKR